MHFQNEGLRNEGLLYEGQQDEGSLLPDLDLALGPGLGLLLPDEGGLPQNEDLHLEERVAQQDESLQLREGLEMEDELTEEMVRITLMDL